MGNSATYFKEVFQRAENLTSEPETTTCAPAQSLTDPRSPTVQFSRTPIEVEGLPIRMRSRMTAHLVESLDPTTRESYLNSNDIVDSPDVEEIMRKMCRMRFLSDDPRSPSAGIVRTPIQVEFTPDDSHKSQKVCSLTDSLVTATSLEDLVFPPDDSPSTSGNHCKPGLLDPRSPSEEFTRTPIQLPGPSDSSNQQLVNKHTSQSNGRSDSNYELGDVTANQSKIVKPAVGRVTPAKRNTSNEDPLIRKLFGTPDSKELSMQTPVKARTPLRTVSSNGNSPQQILRVKQSRGINLEMGRMSGIENNPPEPLNIYDSRLEKNKQLSKYASSNWDHDSTIII